MFLWLVKILVYIASLTPSELLKVPWIILCSFISNIILFCSYQGLRCAVFIPHDWRATAAQKQRALTSAVWKSQEDHEYPPRPRFNTEQSEQTHSQQDYILLRLKTSLQDQTTLNQHRVLKKQELLTSTTSLMTSKTTQFLVADSLPTLNNHIPPNLIGLSQVVGPHILNFNQFVHLFSLKTVSLL